MYSRHVKWGRLNIKNILAVIIIGLLVAHLGTVYLTTNDFIPTTSVWAFMFDLDREYNVPTYTNALLLVVSAVISGTLAVKSKKQIHRTGWFSFSILFLYFGLDEALIIHEQLAEPTRKLLNIGDSNPFYHAWVVPGICAVFIFISMIIIIRKYFVELKIFATTLRYVVIMAAGVIILEITGTFVYSNTSLYRLMMIPMEEIFELTMVSVILNHLIGELRKTY